MFFCLKFYRPVCPTNRYPYGLRQAGQSASVILHTKNIFSLLKFLHRANNQNYPKHDWQLESTLKALKRELSGAPLQTLSITPYILLKMYLYIFVDTEKPKDIAIWTYFLYIFYCMLHKASAVHNSLDAFNAVKELARSKIDIVSEDNVVLV